MSAQQDNPSPRTFPTTDCARWPPAPAHPFALDDRIRNGGPSLRDAWGALPDLKLTVKCVKATDLEAADLNGKSDPYVKVFSTDDYMDANKTWKEQFKTKVVKKNLNPEWNHTGEAFKVRRNFVFSCGNIERDAEWTDRDPSVRLEVWDKDTLSKDDFLGSANVYWRGCSTTPKTVEIPLTGVTRGTVTLELSLSDDDTFPEAWAKSRAAIDAAVAPKVEEKVAEVIAASLYTDEQLAEAKALAEKHGMPGTPILPKYLAQNTISNKKNYFCKVVYGDDRELPIAILRGERHENVLAAKFPDGYRADGIPAECAMRLFSMWNEKRLHEMAVVTIDAGTRCVYTLYKGIPKEGDTFADGDLDTEYKDGVVVWHINLGYDVDENCKVRA